MPFGCISKLLLNLQGYVDRETALIGSLTVREFLYYSALLQLPGFFCQKKSVVEDAIHAMSLGDHANKLIGGHCYMKGLPSGERRLVSIARELVMRPRILFIDEPLYHLDRCLFFSSIHFSLVIILYYLLDDSIPYLVQFFIHIFVIFLFFKRLGTFDDGYIEETCEHWLHSYRNHLPEQHRSLWSF